ncbi:MAG TPA: hypothetical protein VEQ63_14810, partial [Bryobacteraceae bacterium]|nr:hypothetical protein [Bryobacteraceae bacterium]
LVQAGLPVPHGRTVSSADDAVAAFFEIGGPVVVKPLDGNQGRGVSLNLRTAEDVREAFNTASQHSSQVIVEQLFTGRDYRVLVVNGRVVAASEKTPAHVVGDGVHTIAELIEIVNCEPDRGECHSKSLSRITVDSVLHAHLRRNGLSMSSVPAANETILLRESANLSTGGLARDVTDLVHPEIAAMCERAVRVIGLDICGLDVVLPSIDQKYTGEGGFIELNAAPGIRMHHFPSEGQSRDAGMAIVEMLFPNGSTGRIPLIAVAGQDGGITTRMIGHVLTTAKRKVGVKRHEGLTIAGRDIWCEGLTGRGELQVLLSDPEVDAAVVEISGSEEVQSDLGHDWLDVVVFTPPPASRAGERVNLSQGDRQIGKDLAQRCGPSGTVIVSAEDDVSGDLGDRAALSEQSRDIVLVSLASMSRCVAEHIAAGGSAYVLHGDWLEVRKGDTARRLVRASSLPCTSVGNASPRLASALAAAAACAAVGVPLEMIAAALQSFQLPETGITQNKAQEVGTQALPVLHGERVATDREEAFGTLPQGIAIPA